MIFVYPTPPTDHLVSIVYCYSCIPTLILFRVWLKMISLSYESYESMGYEQGYISQVKDRGKGFELGLGLRLGLDSV